MEKGALDLANGHTDEDFITGAVVRDTLGTRRIGGEQSPL